MKHHKISFFPKQSGPDLCFAPVVKQKHPPDFQMLQLVVQLSHAPLAQKCWQLSMLDAELLGGKTLSGVTLSDKRFKTHNPH